MERLQASAGLLLFLLGLSLDPCSLPLSADPIFDPARRPSFILIPFLLQSVPLHLPVHSRAACSPRSGVQVLRMQFVPRMRCL